MWLLVILCALLHVAKPYERIIEFMNLFLSDEHLVSIGNVKFVSTFYYTSVLHLYCLVDAFVLGEKKIGFRCCYFFDYKE